MSKKYNNFSPKLKAMLPKLKPGEKMKFQLDGLHYDKVTKKLVCPASVSIKPIERIYDPYAVEIKDEKGKVTGYEGDYIDIAFINREVPAPSESSRDTIVEFGRVEFLRTNAGVIEVIGGNMAMEKLLPFLFFSNRNSDNVSKPWYVKPAGGRTFSAFNPGKKAADRLKGEVLIDQAKAIVMGMTDEEIEAASAGIFPGTYRHMDRDERLVALRDLAQKDPTKIIDLSQDVEVKTTAFIEECLKEGLIQIDPVKGAFIWPDDKTVITRIKPGLSPHQSLKRYFMTDDGVEALSALEKQLELSKKPKKQKTEKVVVE